MSAFGDISCPYCGVTHYELDEHECEVYRMKDTIAELRDENQTLRDFEKRRIYASPERWKELLGYEVVCKQYRENCNYNCAEALAPPEDKA